MNHCINTNDILNTRITKWSFCEIFIRNLLRLYVYRYTYVSIECIPINNGGLGHCMNAEESDHLPEKKENKNENIGKFVGAKGMHCFMAKQSMNETIYPENLGHFIAIFLQQFRGMLICS